LCAIGNTFLDPFLPVHVVAGVEIDGAYVHDYLLFELIELSWEYVEVVGEGCPDVIFFME
jgi:hypothetical protein